MAKGHYLRLPDGHEAQVLPRLGPRRVSKNPTPTYMRFYHRLITMGECNGLFGELRIKSLALEVDDLEGDP